MLTAALVLLVVGAGALGLVGQRAVSGQQAALRTIGHDTAPDVASAGDISFSLADMDANAANYLLVGDRTDLGLTRQQATDLYDERRSTVIDQLANAASNAGSAADRELVGEILDGLGAFEADVARARLLSDQGDPAAAVRAYTEATDLMHDDLLPAADQLGSNNAAGLQRTYDNARSAATLRLALLSVIGLGLLTLLIVTQIYLRRRMRRIFNPGLVAATLLTAGLLVGLTVVLHGGAEDLRAANQDAFASVLALSQARAVAYDANGDESRYLIDPGRAPAYEETFFDRTTQLVALDGATLQTFDDTFATALGRAKSSDADDDVAFDGYFGTALRNITFDGERDLALTTLDTYAVYQTKDRQIRALEASGNHAEAVRFCLSYDQGDSNWAYARFDDALTGFRDLNQGYFERFIDRGDKRLAGWSTIALAVAAAIIALVVLGLWWRLAEYRS